MDYGRGWQTPSVKGQTVYTLGFMGYMVSVATTQLCCYSKEEAVDDT